MNSAQPADVS